MSDTYAYPLLAKMTEAFSGLSKRELKNVYVSACQHIIEPQKKMLELLSSFGIPEKNISVFGKIYSTNTEVLQELKEEDFKAEQPTFNFKKSFDEQHQAYCKEVCSDLIKSIPNNGHILVLDDGADLLLAFNARVNEFNASVKIIGIEQTSSGFRKLEKEKLAFPVINVARSPIKLDKESPLIARLGCDRIQEVIKKYAISEPRILVVGLGPMGNNVLLILKGEGYFAFGHDVIFDSESEIIDLVQKNNINIIVGSTGTNILDEKQIADLNAIVKSKLYLVSMSSADREFPAALLRQNEVSDSPIHSDAVWNNLVLINNGFPITFKGKRYESTPIEIEKTIALLYGSVLYAATHEARSPGLIDVPEIVTDVILKNG